jgi:hypothetical protein
LCRAISIYTLVARRPALLKSNLGSGHLQEVLRLDVEQQDRLLDAAEQHRWSVKTLRKHVRSVGAPPTRVIAREVATVRLLRNYVEAAPLASAEEIVRGLSLDEARELHRIAQRLSQEVQTLATRLLSHMTTLEANRTRA